ncbi:MAG: homocysteine S-methyltransferase family protein [Dehalococcoidia bacterium]|nr:homocysteine S-methyltransferase family protein [Dehalococcoidia bacterium]
MTLLIDGGMGQELRARGVNPDAKSAGNALTKSAKIVQEIHEEFINAGAEIITTWNYSLTKHRLGLLNMSDKLNEMTQLAVNITNKARMNVGNSQVRIAGCLPPLRASYEPNEQEFGSMVEEYDEIATYLDPGVDLFLCETMSSANEAAAAAEAASKFGKPLWVSWTLRDDADGLLRSGETLDEALSKIENLPVEAVLLNCCDVTTIANAIPALQTKTTRMIGAYANSFTPISKDWKRDGDHLRELRELTPEDYAHQALQWRANGAQIIGGCCGIGPVHISHMRTVIDRNE